MLAARVLVRRPPVISAVRQIVYRAMESTSPSTTTKRVKLSPDAEGYKLSDEASRSSAEPLSPEKRASSADPPQATPTDSLVNPSAAEACTNGSESISKVWKPLVWVDCEMTGLNVYEDNIIEICCLITDGHLNLVDEVGYESTVYVPRAKLDAMDEWCLEHHGDSGLIDKVLAHREKTIDVVEAELLQYLSKHIAPKAGVLAGNTIHMDRFFMNREMPKVLDYLHYRIVDVSSIMEIGFRHNPALMKKFPKKKGAHTARADILESLDQLRWYRDNYFVQPEQKDENAGQKEKAEPHEQPTHTVAVDLSSLV